MGHAHSSQILLCFSDCFCERKHCSVEYVGGKDREGQWTWAEKGEPRNSRKTCVVIQMLPLLFEFSSLIKKCIILWAPGTAKSTFCRLLGFWQTELRQSRGNSPGGVWTSTSKVGQVVVLCLKELSATPADQMYGGRAGSMPTGQRGLGGAWPGRKVLSERLRYWRSSFPAFLSLLPDVGALIRPLLAIELLSDALKVNAVV